LNYLKFIRTGKLKAVSFNLNRLKFGSIGLKALTSGIIDLKQIECFKQMVSRNLKYNIKIWDRKLPYITVTKKPIGIKMGKGSGKISGTVLNVNRGNILLEFSGLKPKTLLAIICSIKARLPIRTKIISNSLLVLNFSIIQTICTRNVLILSFIYSLLCYYNRQNVLVLVWPHLV
jgi:large subunit ribosomal protein L16